MRRHTHAVHPTLHERGDKFVSMKRVLTYGTFDLLHWGHINLLKRARELGDYLVVAVSTDEFNEQKYGKPASYHDFEVRRSMLEAVRYVDLVIPEASWEQKVQDVEQLHIDTVVMGSDWQGSERFEHLRSRCDVVYLPRTEGVSTSQIRRDLLVEAVSDQRGRRWRPRAPHQEHAQQAQGFARSA